MRKKGEAFDKDRHVSEVLRCIARYGRPSPEHMKRWAEKWGCEAPNVSNNVSEAFRFIRLSRQDWQQDVDTKLLQLEADRRTALAIKRPLQREDGTVEWYRAPDCKAAIRATEVYLHAIGAMVRKSQRKHPEGSLDDLRQKRDAVRLALGDLDAVIEQKEGEVH